MKKSIMKKTIILFLICGFYAIIEAKLISLSSVIDYAQSLFKPSVVAQLQTFLLENAYYEENRDILVDEAFAEKLIDFYLKSPKNLLTKPVSVIQQPLKKNISVVQFQVNRQRANSCGYHTIYNLKAIQDLIENGEIINEKNVRTISKMYFDGFLAETGQRESDMEEMAVDEDIMRFGSFVGLQNYFLIQYFDPYNEFVKSNLMPAGFVVVQKELRQAYESDEQLRAISDVKNTLKNKKLTSFVLRMGAHFVSLSVIKQANNQYKIIYMNSTNSSLYDSESTLNFVEWVKNLIL